MAKLVKRFRPKYIKRIQDRPSGIAQTGAHATSAFQNPPDVHRLGWAPRPFPRTGLTGQMNSTIMGAMGTGQYAYYTDEDKEDFKKMSGPPGKSGNYQSDMARHYFGKLKSRAMLGAPQGISENDELRFLIRALIAEAAADEDAFAYELMRSQEGDDEEDDDEVDEQSVAANVAGYSLPLGMSNRKPGSPPSWASYADAIGGTPVKVTGSRTLKVQRMNS